jgi:hypothetical protein
MDMIFNISMYKDSQPTMRFVNATESASGYEDLQPLVDPSAYLPTCKAAMEPEYLKLFQPPIVVYLILYGYGF